MARSGYVLRVSMPCPLENGLLTASLASFVLRFAALIDKKEKVNAKYYVESLLPSLVADCNRLLPGGFIFQQDRAPTQTARLTQMWIAANCPDDEFPPSSPDLNPLDFHV